MAGHSKWANIQHRKGAQDAKRGKLFTKLIREITVAARVGDPDPASNPRLRLAVDKALGGNMTRDTIERAIKRGSAEVRHAFTKAGGNLGTDGSVAYQFTKSGVLSYPNGSDEDQIMEAALEAGADDVLSNDDGSVDVLTAPDQFVDIKEGMVAAGLEPEQAEVTMRAANTQSLDQDEAEKMIRLLDRLEDLDDVQNVYSNADISDEILEKLG
jgi:transcriptional/translational regulatory protein YebC/TACO1